MPKKKSDKSEESTENQELVRRVDSMMSTELPADVPPKPVVMADEPDSKKADGKKPSDKKPAASAPKNQKTAPELPSKALKDTGAEEIKVTKLETPAKPPLVISLADEATKDNEPEEAAEEPAAEADSEVAKPPQTPANDPLEDNATDKAVDDIVAHEGDTVLAVNDALTARKQATAEPGQISGRRRSHKLFWIVILIILLGTAADAAIFLMRR